MSLTLGLNTALSGLLTNQRGLDVIAQNVVNVNTVGYTRKVMNPESKVLAGRGAGVQEAPLTRMVNEGLLKDIRRQTSNLGKLQTEQDYFARIDDLFGEVGSDSSIAHRVGQLTQAFSVLATDVNKPAVQWSTMQAGLSVTQQLNALSDDLQKLRLQADQDIEQTIVQINEQLANIHDLNQKIVKNSAISTGVADLEDKRDLALTKLSELIDIQYFQRGDGAVIVYTSAGDQLVDNQASTLGYTANTNIQSWMTTAGGHFNAITVNSDPADISTTVAGGKLRALIDFRDTRITNMQAEVDNLAMVMKETINQVHNRGTSLPAIASSYTGTRTFATQGDTVTGVTSSTAEFFYGTNSITENAGGGTALYGTDITWGSSTSGITITAQGGSWPAGLAAGDSFSVNDPTNPRNSGTYKVVSNVGAVLTVEKVNVRQTMQLSGTEDVVISTFDDDGNQLQTTTLNTIMQTDFDALGYGPITGDGRSAADFTAKSDHGDWTINEVSAHIQAWMRQQGYTNAVCKLDGSGHFTLDLKDATTSIAFRDQTSSAQGATATDATIAFDVNGDGATDQTVKGFSNFFGLNDFFVMNGQNSIFDSAVQASTYTTTVLREDFALYDTTGQIGTTFDVPAGSSLEDIADLINRYTRTNESARQTVTDFVTTSAATITVSNGSATVATVNLAAGNVSLHEIAGQLTQNGLTGSVVKEGEYYRLRVVDSSGAKLSVSITGGSMSGIDLGKQLDMQATERVSAEVIPEGSGQRLRIVHSQNIELFASAKLDVNDTNLLSDLGLARAATRSSDLITVRSDIQSAPEKIGRGAMLWNADTNAYYISEGDNTTALAMTEAMNEKTAFTTAGGIYAGRYSVGEYAAASVGLAARSADNSKEAYDYQATLNKSLDFQYTSYSGVNLDEEVSAMIDFQQAYAATAKVITVLQEMLETLTSMIR